MVRFFKIKTEKCNAGLLFIFLICVLVASVLSCQSSKNAETLHDTRMQYRSIGEQIRKERIDRGLSQKELADAVKMSQETLSLIEDGFATPIQHKMVAIEEFLGVELINDRSFTGHPK